MNKIQVQNLSRRYLVNNKPFFALNNFTASFPMDKISVILGKSGVGKTTLVRLIASLEYPDSGRIEGVDLLRIKMIFQEPRLMPWLDIENNVKFWGDSKKSCDELLEQMNLSFFKKLYPSQISGGMAQKTALARALYANPGMILMDEPFVSLDYFTRRELQQLLLTLCAQHKLGVIFITHNVDEAVLLGDELFVMEAGQLKKQIKNIIPMVDRENTIQVDQLKKEILTVVEA